MFIFEIISKLLILLERKRHHGLMVRRCFPVAKIVGSSPTGVDIFALSFFLFARRYIFSFLFAFCKRVDFWWWTNDVFIRDSLLHDLFETPLTIGIQQRLLLTIHH
jgi:hypothetical protein